ncbi:carbohydrate binding family 9 domain-containing protein, partial [Thioalkalivibrio sp. XN8]|uniref:carbohydrate binding family 9 domain-containing protein n=1 Tax=Thioalkalivibrio sp. XN8 TaxID=2712863 RepID=UPI0013ED793B
MIHLAGIAAVLTGLAADERIRLDGVLDEAAWQRAAALDDLRQSQPVPGAPGSQRTVVRLAYDDAHLFIAVAAFDDAPEGIVARQLQRDSELFFDDHVTVVLDPHGRTREGYLFRVNPLGARSDAMIFEGRGEDFDWDGRWRAAARLHEAGWTVEIAIPFTTLSVEPQATRWGVNVERRIARANERVRLAGGLRETPISSLADTMPLAGVPVVAPGLGVRLEPYLALRGTRDHEGAGSDTELTPGLDVFYQVTPAITAALTINTDFAEAEVDEQRVNLTRFPLFFPEKREFFLQDTALFRFAGLGQSPLPFFSRRIGLDEAGNPVDIDFGGKVSGRRGRLAFGALGAR